MAVSSRETQLVSAEADSMFDVPKLSRSTLNEEVYEQLKQALMSGKITPGSTMTIRSLASSFGISVMPVREALRRLVAEHVLILLPTAALPFRYLPGNVSTKSRVSVLRLKVWRRRRGQRK